MKQIILLFLFVASTNVLSAQNSIIDSLKNILPIQKEDTNKVKVLIEIGHQYFRTNYDSFAIKYWEQAITLSEKTNFPKGKAKVYFWLGQKCEVEGKYAEARKYYVDALKINRDLNDNSEIGGNYISIASSYWGEDNYPEVLSNTYLALRYYEESNDRDGICLCYQNIGYYYYTQGDYPEALKNQEIAFRESENAVNEGTIAGCNMALAITYLKLGRYSEALQCDSAALVYARKKNFKGAIAAPLTNIGNVLEMQGTIFLNKGNKKEAIKKYKEAEKNFTESSKLWQELADNLSYAYGCINQGRINVRLGNLSVANTYLEKGFQISREMKNKDNIKEYYYALSMLDSAKNDFKKAFEDHKIYDAYRDSLSNDQISRRAMLYKSKYDAEKKEAAEKAEAERILHEKERRENLQIMAISIFIITFIVFVILLNRKKVTPRTVEFMGLLALLMLFEFISLLIHPFIENITNHSPIFMLLILVSIAAVLVPLHHTSAKWVKEKMVKRIKIKKD